MLKLICIRMNGFTFSSYGSVFMNVNATKLQLNDPSLYLFTVNSSVVEYITMTYCWKSVPNQIGNVLPPILLPIWLGTLLRVKAYFSLCYITYIKLFFTFQFEIVLVFFLYIFTKNYQIM